MIRKIEHKFNHKDNPRHSAKIHSFLNFFVPESSFFSFPGSFRPCFFSPNPIYSLGASDVSQKIKNETESVSPNTVHHCRLFYPNIGYFTEILAFTKILVILPKSQLFYQTIGYFTNINLNTVLQFSCYRGLYLGYLKLRTSVDVLSIMVPNSHTNVLPFVKIQDIPNVTKEEWTWLKSSNTVSGQVF